MTDESSPLHSRSWLGVKGKPLEVVCVELDLHLGMVSTQHMYFPLEGARSDAGWSLIVGAGFDHRLIQPPLMVKLSQGCEVLTCTCDERNLSSAATAWRHGAQEWSITYNGEDSPEVVVTGALPPGVLLLQRELIEKSKAEDAGDLLLDPLFEIAIEAVRHFIGYRPDSQGPEFEGRFHALKANHPTLGQRLFGG
jgi:hypothetical protein